MAAFPPVSALAAEAAGPIRGPGSAGRCIDVAGDDTGATGAPVQIWNCLGVADQSWTVAGDGTIRTMGKCMDVEGYGTANGSKVHLWDCHGGGNQIWRPQPGGVLLNPASGRCLDLPSGNLTNGVQLQLWDCNGQWPQSWQLPTVGGQFGNTTIHPDKLGLYAIPDLSYGDAGRTLASLRRLHDLLPSAWIRWDNETGHYRNTPGAVEGFIAQANQAGIPMIIAACCTDGYDNWWARGGSQPVVSIGQIADGPYLAFADRTRRTYPNVRYIETINEADTAWFVADPDDVPAWNHYMDRLYAAVGNDTSVLMGPATAFRTSQIWQNTVGRPQIQQASYHTYGGWRSLTDVGGKAGTWVTEYGDDNVSDEVERSPGHVLADLWNAERNGKLSGAIRQLFYVDLQHMINAGQNEGDHYGFSGQLRALTAYQALGNVSTNAYLDPAHPDLAAGDNGQGRFAALLWNDSGSALTGQTRTVPNTSLTAGAPLNVLTVFDRATGAAECAPIGAQDRVSATTTGTSVTLDVRNLDPRAAVLVTTDSCTGLTG
ncbi:RICIN domain-containing protein [Actinomadura opuntiae]|uniref:RICIN domain-containing protein n=1 Tax=Actinomadura sp. OS1-43 TaxID=604315 RepID=UPI00255ADA0E|nr:RICIN domain-containing protein [Actinomadura sp. OS1-43]MDL4818483.1 RICIN domain-containing protein [Actinomadura sp. OS1-43]